MRIMLSTDLIDDRRQAARAFWRWRIGGAQPPHNMSCCLFDDDREIGFARADHDVVGIEARIAVAEPVVTTEGLHAVAVQVVGNVRLPDQCQRLRVKPNSSRWSPAIHFQTISPFGATS